MDVAKSQVIMAKQTVIKPYPHQEAAVNDAVNEFKLANRATVVMPCGTGKTLVCMWVAEQLKAKNIVVFVPSLALIHQTAIEWVKATSQTLKLMAVCSDQTVALDEDGIVVEKNEFWFPVLSEPQEIKKFLKTQVNNKEVKVIFCTYQSSFNLSEAIGNFKFELGVFDEAHRSAVKGESYFSAPLFDEYIAINKRLFVTATPKQYSLNKKNEQDDFAIVLSMDNEEIYGRHCHVLSFRKAIEQGIISDYKIIFTEVTSDMVAKELRLRENKLSSDKTLHNIVMRIALDKAISKTGVSKIITFHPNIEDAKTFSEILKNNETSLKHHVYHINGKQSSVVRKMTMHGFENKPKSLITNARCLTEGIDAPSVDMVAILSNKKSKIDIIQAIGRALRKHPGKQCGYILVPVFVDTAAGETYEEALYKPEHQVLFELLLALEQHDELLCKAISQGKFDEGYTDTIPTTLLERFVDSVSEENLTYNKFKEDLSIVIINKLGNNWDKMYGKLAKFKEKHGHCAVSKNYKDKQLISWVKNQRTAYKKELLSRSRLELLNSLEFIWDVDEAVWSEMYQELLVFRDKFGHCNVSRSYKNKQLISWVINQRQKYKKDILSQDKIALLNDIGFVWIVRETAWYEMYEKLMKFCKEFNHCCVSHNYTDKQLITWVSIQRQKYKQGKLSQEQINLLNANKFVWSPHDAFWQEMYQRLIKFHDEFGHSRVPEEYKDAQLARWVSTQRQIHKKGQLEQYKIEKLNALNFMMKPITDIWEDKYRLLMKYKKTHGNCLVPQEYKDKKLAIWVGEQRKSYKRGKLGQSKINRLNAIGFVWDPHESAWDEVYKLLVKFKNKHGHCVVPITYKNKQLALWVSTQRQSYKSGKLSQEKLELLNAINFIWTPIETSWDTMYQKLLTFNKKFGHCLVPKNYKDKKLISWVKIQRVSVKKNRLSQEKLELLNAINFVWTPMESSWDEMYQKLLTFNKKFGHCKVPKSYKDKKLMSWVCTQRKTYKSKKLSQERMELLNTINFEWDPRDFLGKK